MRTGTEDPGMTGPPVKVNLSQRPGYNAFASARDNGLDPAGWLALMEDVLRLPPWMLPAVRIAVRKGVWRRANDPVKCVRENARREAARMGMSSKPAVPQVK